MFFSLSLSLVNAYQLVNLGIVQPRCVSLMKVPYFLPTLALLKCYLVAQGYCCHLLNHFFSLSSRVLGLRFQEVLIYLLQLRAFLFCLHSLSTDLKSYSLIMSQFYQKKQFLAKVRRDQQRSRRMQLNRQKINQQLKEAQKKKKKKKYVDSDDQMEQKPSRIVNKVQPISTMKTLTLSTPSMPVFEVKQAVVNIKPSTQSSQIFEAKNLEEASKWKQKLQQIEKKNKQLEQKQKLKQNQLEIKNKMLQKMIKQKQIQASKLASDIEKQKKIELQNEKKTLLAEKKKQEQTLANKLKEQKAKADKQLLQKENQLKQKEKQRMLALQKQEQRIKNEEQIRKNELKKVNDEIQLKKKKLEQAQRLQDQRKQEEKRRAMRQKEEKMKQQAQKLERQRLQQLKRDQQAQRIREEQQKVFQRLQEQKNKIQQQKNQLKLRQAAVKQKQIQRNKKIEQKKAIVEAKLDQAYHFKTGGQQKAMIQDELPYQQNRFDLDFDDLTNKKYELNTQDQDQEVKQTTLNALEDLEKGEAKFDQQAKSNHYQLTEEVRQLEDKALISIDKAQQKLADLEQVNQQLKNATQKSNWNQIKSALSPQSSRVSPKVVYNRQINQNVSAESYPRQIQDMIYKLSDHYMFRDSFLDKWMSIVSPKGIKYTAKELSKRISLLNRKIASFRQAQEALQPLIKPLKYQQRVMEKRPNEWWSAYIEKNFHLEEGTPQHDALYEDEKLFVKALQKRTQQLQKKYQNIVMKGESLMLKDEKKRLQNISKLNEVLETAVTMHQQQEQMLKFMVDKADNQIVALQNQIKIQKKEHQVKIKQEQEKHNKEMNKLLIEQKKLLDQKNHLQNEVKANAESIKQQNELIKQQRTKIYEQQGELNFASKTIQQLRKQNQEQQQEIKTLRSQVIQSRQQIIVLRQKQEGQLKLHALEAKNAHENFLKVIQDTKKKHQNTIKQFNQSNERIVKEKQGKLALQTQKKQELIKEIQALKVSHQKRVEQLTQAMNNQLLKTRASGQRKMNQQLTKAKTQLTLQNNAIASKFKGLEQQYKQYKAKKEAQLQKVVNESREMKTKLEKQLEKIKQKQTELTKKLQSVSTQKKIQIKQLQDQIKAIKAQATSKQTEIQTINQKVKRVQEEKSKSQAMTKRITLENEQKHKKLLQQMKKLGQERQNMERKAKLKQEELMKSLGIAKKQVQNLKIQKKEIQAKLASKAKQTQKMALTVKSLEQVLQKYNSSKVFSLAFKIWELPHNRQVTIRQCFRLQDTQKWIPTTRGIFFGKSSQNKIFQVILYWQKLYEQKSFPAQKVVQRVEGTSILMILDTYKQKKYYSLRQYYYKDGEALPTRRGFNISEQDLKLFLRDIKTYAPLGQIAGGVDFVNIDMLF